MPLWGLFLRLFSSPFRLIASCWRALFSRERLFTTDDEEALISSAQAVPKRKALLLGIAKGAHNDVKDMREVLIEIYGYKENDITMLIDDGDPEKMQPTEENILKEMENLVADARPGDRFYFHYSGHGEQLPDDNGDEEDGQDECIITCEDKKIRDDKLKEIMVNPLPPGCSFVSVFDACHSGTMLDLIHYRCNRVYVPWVSKGIPRAHPPHDAAGHQTGLSAHYEHHISVHSPTTLSAEAAASTAHIPPHPDPHFCKGRCREDPFFLQDVQPIADVVSLSAAKDYQLSWVKGNESSLTQALIDVLKNDKNPTLTYLLTSVRQA